MRKKKCYIYTRVSTAAQTEGYSLEAQQERLREYADYKNLEIAGDFCGRYYYDSGSETGRRDQCSEGSVCCLQCGLCGESVCADHRGDRGFGGSVHLSME